LAVLIEICRQACFVVSTFALAVRPLARPAVQRPAA
jgi:hypothetical protein